MAALNLQLPGLQENLNVSATPARAPDTDATTTPVNSNVAQSSPAPLDTVTLAGQAASGQGTEQGTGQGTDQNQRERQLQQNALFFVPNSLANLGSDQTGNANTANSVSQAASQQVNTKGSASAKASEGTPILQGVSSSGPFGQQNLGETQKQQLHQLDQTLRQLGIDPQSISVFNQLALLFFSNNPAGLKQFLTQFQQAAQQLLDQNSSQATSENIASAAAAAASQLGIPTTSSADSAASGAATQPSSGSLPFANTNAPADEGSIHFQDLQFAVAAVGGQLQTSATGSANLQSQGESLNVTFLPTSLR